MTALNKTFVEEHISHLHDEYGDVPVDDGTIEVTPSEFPEYVQNARDGYVGSAYAWVVRQPEQAGEPSETYSGPAENRERALLILPRGGSAWGVPGGGREGDESFEAAAVREVHEEAGINCVISDLWHLEHLRWQSEDDADDRVTHTLHAFFDGEYVDGTLGVQQAEVNGVAWFAERPERLDSYAEQRADLFF